MKLITVKVSTDYEGNDETRDKRMLEAYAFLDPNTNPWVLDRSDVGRYETSNPRYMTITAKIFESGLLHLMQTDGIKIKVEGSKDVSQIFDFVSRNQTRFRDGSHDSLDTNFNHLCNVHISGHSLSTYNDLLLLSDVCTDTLQDHIDRDWRILAVCPMPDQRRPDYVLGRYNPSLNTQGHTTSRGALRHDPEVSERKQEETIKVSEHVQVTSTLIPAPLPNYPCAMVPVTDDEIPF